MNDTATILAIMGSALGIACTIIACAAAAIRSTWKIAETVASFREDLDRRLDSIEVQVENQYSLPRAAEVALRTKLANPALNIPDPRDPKKLIEYTHPG
jgi:hypothetical protein